MFADGSHSNGIFQSRAPITAQLEVALQFNLLHLSARRQSATSAGALAWKLNVKIMQINAEAALCYPADEQQRGSLFGQLRGNRLASRIPGYGQGQRRAHVNYLWKYATDGKNKASCHGADFSHQSESAGRLFSDRNVDSIAAPPHLSFLLTSPLQTEPAFLCPKGPTVRRDLRFRFYFGGHRAQGTASVQAY